MERETGIEPATNSLEGCDSTTELLPPSRPPLRLSALRRTGPLRCDTRLPFAPHLWLATRSPRSAKRNGGKGGGEGRTRTFEGARPTDLQSAAFDRFATSPMRCLWMKAFAPPARLRAPARTLRREGKLAKGFEPPTG